jgi:phosphoglycerate dehydrogenase-like enzyme
VSELTLLVVADPAAPYLTPLAQINQKARMIVTNDRSEVLRVAPEADVLLNGDFRNGELFQEAFRQGKRLRWVHSPAAGVEKVLSPEIAASKVPLTNGRGVFARPLGEWIVGAMLFFTYDMRKNLDDQRAHAWKPAEHGELYGQTLAIIGYGSIGHAAEERARAFGMKILTIRRGENAKLREVLSQCDFAAVCAPLTRETRGMIGAAEIAAMKKTAVIINVGRGPVIDEKSLIAALKEKKIRGAALDVFETEPLPANSPFFELENVLISPHSADFLPDLRERALQFFVENFDRFVKGEPLQNVVDKHAGY